MFQPSGTSGGCFHKLGVNFLGVLVKGALLVIVYEALGCCFCLRGLCNSLCCPAKCLCVLFVAGGVGSCPCRLETDGSLHDMRGRVENAIGFFGRISICDGSQWALQTVRRRRRMTIRRGRKRRIRKQTNEGSAKFVWTAPHQHMEPKVDVLLGNPCAGDC